MRYLDLTTTMVLITFVAGVLYITCLELFRHVLKKQKKIPSKTKKLVLIILTIFTGICYMLVISFELYIAKTYKG